MKNIKYILFTIIIIFSTIKTTNAATCVFGNDTFNLTCTTGTNGKGTCKVAGKDSIYEVGGNHNYHINTRVNPKIDNTIIEKCNGVYLAIYDEGIDAFYDSMDENNLRLYIPGGTKQNTGTSNEPTEEVKTCKYGDDKFNVTCDVSTLGMGKCRYGGSDVGNYHIYNNELNNTTIKKCDTVYLVAKDVDGKIGIFSSSGTGTSTGLIEGARIIKLTKYYEGKTPETNNNPTPTDPTTPTNPGGSGNDTSDDLDLDTFCQGKVLGVFTAIGWFFFFVKIIVPIVLMIFGVIDISKAVISSKDDEIKKSTKSLITRAICGVIIFFIPTVLNLVVNLVGDRAEGVYTGTFADCTSCMFKPNQEGCKGLMGDY